LTSRGATSRANQEHASGVRRLDEAVAEQARSRDQREAVQGTSGELEANASLRAADEQVAARERWLEWVGDHNY
jgi:hypothetical protein